MKIALMMSFLVMGTIAQAGIQPNDCNDGAIYRALPGVDGLNKNISFGGQTLIECQVGNTTTCVGAPYNAYTCNINFLSLTGNAAKAVSSNVNFGMQKELIITSDLSTQNCGHMHCRVQNILTCTAPDACVVTPVLSGWDE